MQLRSRHMHASDTKVTAVSSSSCSCSSFDFSSSCADDDEYKDEEEDRAGNKVGDARQNDGVADATLQGAGGTEKRQIRVLLGTPLALVGRAWFECRRLWEGVQGDEEAGHLCSGLQCLVARAAQLSARAGLAVALFLARALRFAAAWILQSCALLCCPSWVRARTVELTLGGWEAWLSYDDDEPYDECGNKRHGPFVSSGARCNSNGDRRDSESSNCMLLVEAQQQQHQKQQRQNVCGADDALGPLTSFP